MKYKNRLIIPTAIALSITTASLKANADELDTTEDVIIPEEIEHTSTENTVDSVNDDEHTIVSDSEEDIQTEHDSGSNLNDVSNTEDTYIDHNEDPALEETEEALEQETVSDENEIKDISQDAKTVKDDNEADLDKDINTDINNSNENLEENNDSGNSNSDNPVDDYYTEHSLSEESGNDEKSSNTDTDSETPSDFESDENDDVEDKSNDKSSRTDDNNKQTDTDLNKKEHSEEDSESKTSADAKSDEDYDENVEDKTDQSLNDSDDSDENAGTEPSDNEELNGTDNVSSSNAKKSEDDEDNNKDKSDDLTDDKNSENDEVTEEEITLYNLNLNSQAVSPNYSSARLVSRIKDNNNSGLFSPVTSKNSVSAKQFNDSTLYISEKAVYGGETFYKIHNRLNGAMQGWMKEKDLKTYNITAEKNHNQKYSIKQESNHHYLLSDPFGNKNQQTHQLSDINSTTFQASKHVKVGALHYYYGKIGNRYGWLQDNKLTDYTAPPKYTNANHATRITSGNNSGLYSPVTSSNSVSAKQFNDSTLYISEKANYDGEIYYKVHNRLNGAMQGWMKEKDLKLYNITSEKAHNKKYSIKSNQTNHYLLSDPFGDKNQQTHRLSSINSSTFEASKHVKVGALHFYYGKIGNRYGWLQDNKLTDYTAPPKYYNAQHATRINNNNNSGIFSPVTSSNSVSAKQFNSSTLYVSERAVYEGETYYKIHNRLNGAMQGWMKAEDLKVYDMTSEKSHNKKYTIRSNRTSDFLLSDPFGHTNQQTHRLNSLGSTTFEATKHVKVGALHFYYGKIGNRYGWLQDTKLTDFVDNKPQTQVVKYHQSLNNVLNTQMNLGAKPQAWNGNGGWRNATRNEVRQYLDTSNHKGGAWDYTFLNLDQSQGIAASTLNNNVLGNRGILTNQGNAFSQASKAHGVNEVYLISHAILETGHGQSQLAQGVRLDNNGNISNNGKKYYNMYGIGAVDHNAVLGGARYAQQMGWDTPAKAIVGGAQFVSQNYFGRGQNTLYSMRWNPNNPGTYQYATDVNWAYATANNLKNYYDQLGIQGRFFTRHEF